MTQHPQEHEPSSGEQTPEASGTPTMSEQEIQDWFITHIAERLFIDPEEISVQEAFTTFGLSSREAVVLSGELEERLGRELSPTLLYE